MSQRGIVSLYPPAFSKQNSNALDWSSGNFVACATGCCLHLAYADGRLLKRAYSIEISESCITCVKFHPSLRCIAVGDEKGSIFLFDLDDKIAKASSKATKAADKCAYMSWMGEKLIVLSQNKSLYALEYTAEASTAEHLENFSEKWRMQLSDDYEKFAIDPHFASFLLLFGHSHSFSILRFPSYDSSPVTVFESAMLSSSDTIQDAQWAVDLPGYALILLSHEILLFNVESRCVIQLISQTSAPVSFSFFQQLRSKILVFHRNGTMSTYRYHSSTAYRYERDFQLKAIATSSVQSPVDSSLVSLFIPSMGVSIMDADSMDIISISPIFPSSVTSFDSDGTTFACGTSQGFVIIGSLFDASDLKRFAVGSETVSFVSLDGAKSRVYWKTGNVLGVVDIASRQVAPFASKTQILRCFGSRRGALIIQRDECALGVFVEGRERALVLPSEVIDVSVDEAASTQSNGSFCVLTKPKDLTFFGYSSEGITKISTLRSRGVEGEANCLAVQGEVMVTGFSGGSLLFFDSAKRQTKVVDTGLGKLKQLRFGNHSLFGISDKSLFQVSQGVNICPFSVKSFSTFLDDSLLMLMTEDGVLRFVSSANWSNVESFVLPNEDDCIKNFISSKSRKFYSIDSKAPFEYLDFGKSTFSEIEETNCEFMDRVNSVSEEITRLKVRALMFADRFEEAAVLMGASPANEEGFMQSSLMAAVIFASGGKINERTASHLNSAAISLLEEGRFEEAALLFRLGRLDKEAVNSLFEYGRNDLAARFLSRLSKEERKAAVFKFAVQMISQKRMREAASLFAEAEEFHAVIYVLLSLGDVVDAYYMMQRLKAENRLFELSEEKRKDFPEIEPLSNLCQLIEHQFELTLRRLGISN